MQSIFEQIGGTYSLGEDGMYYPDLVLSEDKEPLCGKYGMLRKTFLREHQKGRYSAMLLQGKLAAHLNEIDDAANARMELLVRQMQEKFHINEDLKSCDPIAWTGTMNQIYNAAEEIVLKELIYI